MLRLTPDELHEVTAQVGFALWQTQITESTVGAYLVLVHKATHGQARSEVEGMFAKAGTHTLGWLLRSIQATSTAPQPLVDALDTFVPRRNWLVHHSRHESHRDMYSAPRRAALIARLAAIWRHSAFHASRLTETQRDYSMNGQPRPNVKGAVHENVMFRP
jgi:hypothetical protein